MKPPRETGPHHDAQPTRRGTRAIKLAATATTGSRSYAPSLVLPIDDILEIACAEFATTFPEMIRAAGKSKRTEDYNLEAARKARNFTINLILAFSDYNTIDLADLFGCAQPEVVNAIGQFGNYSADKDWYACYENACKRLRDRARLTGRRIA